MKIPATESSVPIRVYVKPQQLDQLKALAVADDRSVSALIRRAIDEYLAQHAPQPTTNE